MAAVSGLRKLFVFNNKLYAGGRFTEASGGTIQTRFVAKWNGTSWEEVEGGFNDYVYAFCEFNGELYAGGQFTASSGGTLPAKGIAKLIE